MQLLPRLWLWHFTLNFVITLNIHFYYLCPMSLYNLRCCINTWLLSMKLFITLWLSTRNFTCIGKCGDIPASFSQFLWYLATLISDLRCAHSNSISWNSSCFVLSQIPHFKAAFSIFRLPFSSCKSLITFLAYGLKGSSCHSK